ncbi:MAG: InlB B-repeat-containing protein, partial [Peptococcaceae bacterium]|nr:InlB B-repeat-containing protein [Peptococcaceae bacterium]
MKTIADTIQEKPDFMQLDSHKKAQVSQSKKAFAKKRTFIIWLVIGLGVVWSGILLSLTPAYAADDILITKKFETLDGATLKPSSTSIFMGNKFTDMHDVIPGYTYIGYKVNEILDPADIPGDAPIANPDDYIYNTSGTMRLHGNVMDNDTPSLNLPTRVAEVRAADGKLAVAVPESYNPGLMCTAQALEGGSIWIKDDGSFDFNPKAMFSGYDSFEYRLIDGAGVYSSWVTVTIYVPTPAESYLYLFCDNTQKVPGRPSITPQAGDGEIIVTYLYQMNTYTMSYDGNGSDSGDLLIDVGSPYDHGSTVTVLNQGSLAKANHTFQGWATSVEDADVGTVTYAAGGAFAITENTTLYAVWSEKPQYLVTVKYQHLGFPVGVPSLTTFTKHVDEVFDVTAPLIDDYMFVSWSLVPPIGLTVRHDDTNPSGITMPNGAVTIILYYVPDRGATGETPGEGTPDGIEDAVVTKKFETIDGTTLKGSTQLLVNKDDRFSDPHDAIENYTYVGYKMSYESLAGWVFDMGSVLNNDSPGTIVKALWIGGVEYTVPEEGLMISTPLGGGAKVFPNGTFQYVAPNVNGIDSFQFIAQDEHGVLSDPITVTIALQKFDDPGESGNTVEATLFPAPAEPNYTIVSDIVITYMYELNTYTMTYDGNGNDSGDAPVDAGSPYDHDSTVTVLGQGTLAKTNHAFQGWAASTEDAALGTVTYAADATFSITENTTLYAVWSEKPQYLVTVEYLDRQGSPVGDPSSTSFTKYVDEVFDVTAPLIDEYMFVSWSLTPPIGPTETHNDSNPSGITMANGPITIVLYYGHDRGETGDDPTDSNDPDGIEDVIVTKEFKTDGGATIKADTRVIVNVEDIFADAHDNVTAYTYLGYKVDGGSLNAAPAEPNITVPDYNDITVTYVYEVIRSTLTFDKNHSDADKFTEADPTSLSVTYDQTVGSLPTAPTRYGYDFTGWSTDSGSSNTVNFDGSYVVNFTEAKTVYAVWTAKSVNVVFHTNDGSEDDVYDEVENTFGDPLNPITDPSRDGYTFKRWVDKNGKPYVPGETLVDEEELELYAEWEAVTATLNFNKNHSDVDKFTEADPTSLSVTYDQTVGSLPTAPTRYGYDFTGWSTDSGSGNTVNFDGSYVVTFTEAKTVYAVWTAKSVNVVFHTNDGSKDDVYDEVENTFGDPLNPITDPSRDGYTFKRWVDKNGKPYVPGETLVDEEELELYAEWEAVTATLNFNKNHSDADKFTEADPTSLSVTYDQTVGSLPTAPTRYGYDFTGWSTDSGSGNTVNFDGSYVVTFTEAKTVYAVWTAKTVIVVFHTDDGEDDVYDEVENTFGDPLNPITDPSRDGYTFKRWVDKNGKPYVPGETLVDEEELELYAEWEAVTATLNFNKNHSDADKFTEADPTSLSVTYDQTVGSLPTAPTRYGYDFTGWSTDSGSSNTVNFDGSYVVTFTEAKTVYAVWTA